MCTNSSWLAYIPPLFSQLNTLTIYDIHNLIKVMFMYNFASKNLPSNFDSYFVKTLLFLATLRSAQLFRPAVFKHNLARSTIGTQGPSLCNSLPDNINVLVHVLYLKSCTRITLFLCTKVFKLCWIIFYWFLILPCFCHCQLFCSSACTCLVGLRHFTLSTSALVCPCLHILSFYVKGAYTSRAVLLVGVPPIPYILPMYFLGGR